MFHNLLSTYAVDTLEPYAIWVTVGLVGAFVLTLLSMLLFEYILKRLNKPTKSLPKKFIRIFAPAFLLYAVAMGITMLILEILKKYDVAYLEDNWVSLSVINQVFIPLLITLVISLISGVTLFILARKKSTHTKKVGIILGIIIGLSTLITLVLMGVYFSNNVAGDGYYTDPTTGKLNPIALYLSAGLLLVAMVGCTFFFGRKDKTPFDTHAISLAGVCVALSFALSYVKLWDMPTGGSVTLVSFLPITLFAFIYGSKKGLLVGLLYGVLQAIQDPWLIHPAQFLLDYPIAFSSICFAGILTDLGVLKNLPQLKFTFSALITGTFRWFCHVLSGVFAFGAYASDVGATNFWTYSIIYNSYVFIDIALVIVVGVLLLSSKGLVKQFENLTRKPNGNA